MSLLLLLAHSFAATPAETALILAATDIDSAVTSWSDAKRAERCLVVPSPFPARPPNVRCRFVAGSGPDEVPLALLVERWKHEATQGQEIWFDVGSLRLATTVRAFYGDRQVVQRASTLHGVATDTIIADLKNAGLDLAEVRLGGVKIADLEEGSAGMDLIIGPGPDALSLSSARTVWPDVTEGRITVWDHPSLANLTSVSATEPPPAVGELYAYTLGDYRAVTRPVELPASLADLELTAAPLFAGEHHGVLRVGVPRAQGLQMWKTLAERHPTTGLWPVVLSDLRPSEFAVGWRRQAENVERMEQYARDGIKVQGLRSETHLGTTPADLAAQVDNIDVASVLASNPSYGPIRLSRGPAGDAKPSHTLSTIQPTYPPPGETLFIALVPVDAAWKAPLYLPHFIEAGDATPSMVEVAAVSRYWQQQHGAVVAALDGAVVEWWVEQPLSNNALKRLAPQMANFSPEGGSRSKKGRQEELAGHVWYAWWD